jgi:hypothetical protein
LSARRGPPASARSDAARRDERAASRAVPEAALKRRVNPDILLTTGRQRGRRTLKTLGKTNGSPFAFPPRVPCRIETRQESGRLVVHLAGHLSDAEVPALLEACAQSAEPAHLELDELISADAVGTDTLSRLEEQGVRLVSLPEYLRLKLRVRKREWKP